MLTPIRQLTVLGSTGSIGINTLDVVAQHPQRFKITALTANNSVDKMLAQCRQFAPRFAVMLEEDSAEKLRAGIRAAGLQTEVLSGVAAMERVASLPEVDIVMAAIVGAAGIRPTFAAARAGKQVLLANKETLVMAGRIFMDTVREHRATLLPIDSEHNAIFQSLPRHFDGDLTAAGVKRVLLTASGGPFRAIPIAALATVTPQQACAHPNWVMGKKISVDSATMMNKGLEVIEAHWLFNATPEQIEVVIHPQSVIHSLVEYVDGSVLAQLGNPDMRTPIAYALGYPERIDAGVISLDLCKIGELHFEKPDMQRFPCLQLAYQALVASGSAPAILNAANEVAVAAFLAGKIAYPDIYKLIDHTLATVTRREIATLEDVLAADVLARQTANEWLVCLV